MKKHKLIAMLSHLKYNDEIYFWNDFAHDWQDIDPKVITTEMAKVKPKVLHELIINQAASRGEKYTKTLAEMKADCRKRKTHDWEYHLAEMDEEYAAMHDFKTFTFIQSKPRGKETFDRAGSIRY